MSSVHQTTPQRFDVQELRFDAGSLALNLVATQGRRGTPQPVERLTNCDALAQWFEGVDLPGIANETTLAAIRQLREAMYQILVAIDEQRRPNDDDLATVNKWSGVPLPGRMLIIAADGSVTTADREVSQSDAIAIIVRDFVAFFNTPERRQRIRRCDAADCRMVYLDTSQGRRRRWCSMQRCGNRAKAARHRESQRENSKEGATLT